MSISFKVDDVQITAKRDRAMFNTFAGDNSYIVQNVGDELSVSSSVGSFVVTLGTGEAVICGGSMLSEGAGSELTLSENQSGYLVIRIDLSQTGTNICRFMSVPNLVQENINDEGLIYDLPLYRYSTNNAGVSELTDERVVANSIIDFVPSPTIDTSMSSSSENAVQNKVINSALNGKAPTNHRSPNTTYGVGSPTYYGHVKTINALTQNSHVDGTALSAYQGYVLKGNVDNLASSKMALVSDPTNTDILITNANGQAVDSGMQFATLNRKVKHGLDFSQVLFFGDSFVEGWTPEGTVTTWCTRLANMFSPGFNYQRFYAGGAGFAHVSSSNGHTFETYWDSIVNQINTNTTTIFIMGGYNDKDIANLTTLQNAINSFVTKVRETFPVTQTKIVYIFNPCCQIPLRSLITACNYYMHYNRAIVFSDSYWWNLFRTSFYSTDYLHPNASGHFQIARIIYGKLHGSEYMNNGSVSILTGTNQLELTSFNDIVNIRLVYNKSTTARSVKIADFPEWLTISWNSQTRKGVEYNYRELIPCADSDGSNLAYLYFGGGASGIYINSLANIKIPTEWSGGICYFNKSYDALTLLG